MCFLVQPLTYNIIYQELFPYLRQKSLILMICCIMYCILGFTTQNFLQFFYASCSPLIMIELPKLKNFDGNNGNVSKNRLPIFWSFFLKICFKGANSGDRIYLGPRSCTCELQCKVKIFRTKQKKYKYKQ